MLVTLSNNEINNYCILSVRSAKYPWGISEEYAHGMAKSTPYLPELISWFIKHCKNQFNIHNEILPTICINKQTTKLPNTCQDPIYLGCWILDHLSYLDSSNYLNQSLTINQSFANHLLIPYLYQIAEHKQLSIILTINDEVFATIAPQTIITNQQPKQETNLQKTMLSFELYESEKISKQLKTVDIDEKNLNALQQLSSLTFVESNEQSRLSGAGAGLSDSD